MKLNIRPIFRFRLRDTLVAASAFYGVMVAVTAAFIITTLNAYAAKATSGEYFASFSAYGVAAIITFFVFGICSVREDLRLCLQNGISRRTMFAGTALAGTISAAALAAAGEVLDTIAQTIIAGKPGIVIADLYQVVFLNADIEAGVSTMGFADHFKSFIMIFLTVCLAMAGGAMISLIFYRLPKTWRLVVAIGTPIMLTIGLPMLSNVAPGIMRTLGEALYRGLATAFAGYTRSMVSLLALALLTCFFNWLLLRRAPIKAAK